MDPRRRNTPLPNPNYREKVIPGKEIESPKASDAVPLPLYVTNGVFFCLFFSVVYFLLQRWREKIRNSTPLHFLTLSEIIAIVAFVGSFIYLLGFFGIDFVQSIISPRSSSVWTDDDEDDVTNYDKPPQCGILITQKSNHNLVKRCENLVENGEKTLTVNDDAVTNTIAKLSRNLVKKSENLVKNGQKTLALTVDDDDVTNPIAKSSRNVVKKCENLINGEKTLDLTVDDEEVVESVINGKIPSYSLESKLNDCLRAAKIRREALQRMTSRSLSGLALEGFDYESILGQCCEMPVGYVQIPVGIAGPLLIDGREYSVPMATTEGCLVASTNRGCKAIYVSGGAYSVILKDGMTRAPVVRFGSVRRAVKLKFFLEDPENFETIGLVFNKSSRFARLQSIKCAIAGKNLYIRFTCNTGDAMGMNMVSKGVQNVLNFLQNDFPDMDVIGISGNYCSDKKPAAVNWIEGRGKSVVCEAVIKADVVKKVLKTDVATLVELNMLKNLAGSAVAGALGGFNAHAANIVSAIYIATGQDPAQNVESSHCITMMEAVNGGKDLHISITMPSIEVGTVGGGTQLASQAACLNLLGVKGANKDCAGGNSRLLATIVAGSVLAGELSLMSAIAAGQLVKSHMKYNRSSRDMTKVSS